MFLAGSVLPTSAIVGIVSGSGIWVAIACYIIHIIRQAPPRQAGSSIVKSNLLEYSRVIGNSFCPEKEDARNSKGNRGRRRLQARRVS
jgi:hypothetical protein